MSGARIVFRAIRVVRRVRARPTGYRAGLGHLIAFLHGIVLIRQGANLFILTDLAGHHTAIDLGSFYAATFGVLTAYAAVVLPAGSFRFLHDVLRHPILTGAPQTSRARTIAACGAVFLRPNGLAVPTLVAITVIVSWPIGLTPTHAMVAAGSCLGVAIGGALLLLLALFRLRLPGADADIIEAVTLGVLVLANPDLRLVGNQSSMLLFLSPTGGIANRVIMIGLPVLMGVAVCGAAAIIRGVTVLGNRFRHHAKVPDSSTLLRPRGAINLPLSIFLKRGHIGVQLIVLAVVIPIVIHRTAPVFARVLIRGFPVCGLLIFLKYAAELEDQIGGRFGVDFDRKTRSRLFLLPGLLEFVTSLVPAVVALVV